MTRREIQRAWEHANQLAELIWEAYVTGIGIDQAIKHQQSLKVWLDLVRENGYVYNGNLDEYVNLRLGDRRK
jgi:hypothetical protein